MGLDSFGMVYFKGCQMPEYLVYFRSFEGQRARDLTIYYNKL